MTEIEIMKLLVFVVIIILPVPTFLFVCALFDKKRTLTCPRCRSKCKWFRDEWNEEGALPIYKCVSCESEVFIHYNDYCPSEVRLYTFANIVRM